jgi:glycosyltransferase involved in cell wall biosynthesis
VSADAPGRPLRVLHCPTLVGGHAAGLARAERALGLDSRTLVVHEPPFGYLADEVLAPTGVSAVRREARRWRALLRLLRSFDVVHFNFGSTLTPSWHPASHPLHRLYARLLEGRELQWLRRRGHGIFVTYQGDDARQASERFDAAIGPGYFDPRLDRRKRASIARFDRYADAIYALNPDLLAVLPERAGFLPYASVDPAEWQPVPSPHGSVPVVAHAPSDRRVKGTRHLLEAVEQLRADGVELELVLVEGVTRAEARQAYERCDLLVDQLLTGWYGGAAVELMALGKPVVAHLDADDLARIPAPMRAELPVIDATAASIDAVLAEWLTARRSELPAVGARGRAFVERWHDPLAIAARTKDAYERSLARSRTST